MRRAIAAAMAGVALIAGATVWFATRSPESEPAPFRTPSARPSASPAPVASPSPDAATRLARAVAAAFPKGTRFPREFNVMEFDDHRLIDAPFGPVLVSHGHVEDAGHSDAGTIRVDYLTERDGSFALARSFPKVIELGSMGDLGDWSVSDRFTSLPVIVAEGGGTWQGYSCSMTALAELRPDGPAEVASIRSAYSNGGAVEGVATSAEGKIVDIVRGKGFTMRFTGSMTFDDRYVWRDGRFVLDGKSRLPEC
ncbi:hypothetical protein TPR58_00520 [Sphingomonas sp. HF-S3]|uniref:Lipoprotein n=1 Tax=Sphingomonas rustica TaxID=3103142 RepID=A0ABV0B518_9SPHN